MSLLQALESIFDVVLVEHRGQDRVAVCYQAGQVVATHTLSDQD